MSFFKLSGVHLKHCKNTAESVPQRIGIPAYITLSMSMHIGAPAEPVVKPGDYVKVGQMVGSAVGKVSSSVYSGVSGKVKKIDETITVNGAYIRNVVIESDGLQEKYEGIVPPVVSDRESYLDAVRNSGIVGLGGAGFPTLLKLNADISKIDTVVINGAECEPYITSDTRTMLDDSKYIADGIRMLMKILEVRNVVIGIENNKPQCIKSMTDAVADIQGVTVKPLPALYPQGGEKVLVYHTLGRVIGEGKLPLDVGVVVLNCTTVATLAKYIETGMPLVEKCVTVDGSAVKEPKNVIAPIGTPIRNLFEFCGGFCAEPRKIIYGGPMMGIAVPDIDSPVLKQTNAVLAFAEKEAVPPRVTACIRCGRCTNHCPFGLSPVEISKAYKAKDGAALEKLKVNLCMECGCCSYVCPAKRNLVQRNKLAKTFLRNYQTSQNGGVK